MELIEMIAWVVIGFGPVFGGLELASKVDYYEQDHAKNRFQ